MASYAWRSCLRGQASKTVFGVYFFEVGALTYLADALTHLAAVSCVTALGMYNSRSDKFNVGIQK
ncbi:hypothetical protein LguiA_006101 [Lonicera macranthoides]